MPGGARKWGQQKGGWGCIHDSARDSNRSMTSHANNTGTEGYTGGFALAQAAFRKNDLLRSYHLYIASTPNRLCHGFIWTSRI